MSRVLLVCSAHGQRGGATASELYWLLGRLRPDVLFLEHSPADFSTFMDGSCGTVESAAVNRYRSAHAVQLVPVDSPFQPALTQQNVDELFDRIEKASRRYIQLALMNRYQMERGGFAYLNSTDGFLLQTEMRREMRATVENARDATLTQLYALWTRAHDLRELAMLAGIKAFARQHSFKKGVLLVGAAHRQPIIEKSHQARNNGPSPVTWEFDWEFDETLPDVDMAP